MMKYLRYFENASDDLELLILRKMTTITRYFFGEIKEKNFVFRNGMRFKTELISKLRNNRLVRKRIMEYVGMEYTPETFLRFLEDKNNWSFFDPRNPKFLETYSILENSSRVGKDFESVAKEAFLEMDPNLKIYKTSKKEDMEGIDFKLYYRGNVYNVQVKPLMMFKESGDWVYFATTGDGRIKEIIDFLVLTDGRTTFIMDIKKDPDGFHQAGSDYKVKKELIIYP